MDNEAAFNKITDKFEVGDRVIDNETGQVYEITDFKVFSSTKGDNFEYYVYLSNAKGGRAFGNDYLHLFYNNFESALEEKEEDGRSDNL